jgi:hypothetical protein
VPTDGTGVLAADARDEFTPEWGSLMTLDGLPTELARKFPLCRPKAAAEHKGEGEMVSASPVTDRFSQPPRPSPTLAVSAQLRRGAQAAAAAVRLPAAKYATRSAASAPAAGQGRGRGHLVQLGQQIVDGAADLAQFAANLVHRAAVNGRGHPSVHCGVGGWVAWL